MSCESKPTEQVSFADHDILQVIRISKIGNRKNLAANREGWKNILKRWGPIMGYATHDDDDDDDDDG